ncbi:MerR family transcriptional regulator [Devosia faecipullorum]|uniref:hypothetical protein n=1 Tax=Devosia faecipullorum TaxID=2755039 RepID=UPI00187BADCD|nr:hypothetical protein [Devosia faecipullorum]MBE7734636.1 hypothetical protein [Devosia faecipullorum]
MLELYGVCPNTLRNWRRTGLASISGLKPSRYLGSDLNRFRAERANAAKRKPVASELYCLPCGSQQDMAGRVVEFSSHSGSAGRLTWTCPTFGHAARLTIGPTTLERLEAHGVFIQR